MVGGGQSTHYWDIKMALSIVSLICGLILLVFAGDYLVRGAVGLADKMGISPLIVGLTIVALGTSAPELVVSIDAALNNVPGLALGNVIGSNIANVLMVLGVPALILPVATAIPGIKRNIFAMLGFTIVFMVMLSNGWVGRVEAALLLGSIILFVAYQIRLSMSGEDIDVDEVEDSPHDNKRIALYIIGGIIALPIAAELVVSGASTIASAFGVSDTAIGLSIVAIGTSLPELATSFMAAWRGSTNVAVGNVVGSNIFNIGLIIGVTGLIVPMDVDPRIISQDMWVMAAVTLLVAIMAFAKVYITRGLGAAMLLAYVTYLYTVF